MQARMFMRRVHVLHFAIFAQCSQAAILGIQNERLGLLPIVTRAAFRHAWQALYRYLTLVDVNQGCPLLARPSCIRDIDIGERRRPTPRQGAHYRIL